MRKLFVAMLLALAPFAATFAQDVVGKWKLGDESAIVEVYQDGDVFNGRIVWLKNPTRPDGSPAVDHRNPKEELRGRQLIGLNMLSNLKASKNGEYSGGEIYDPGNGKTYYCSMEVDGNVLKVRGSLDKRGFLGRTMDWFRVKE